MAIRRTNQGGSVATFVVIGIILAASLIGAIYFVTKRGEQARKEQSITETKKETDNKKPVKSDESSKPETEETKQPEELSTTGPELSIGELVAVFSITAVISAYIMSRRKLSHSL